MKIPRTSVSDRGSSKKNGFDSGLMKRSKQWSLGKNMPSSTFPIVEAIAAVGQVSLAIADVAS